MHLDGRKLNRADNVPNCDTGVRVGGWVNYKHVDAPARALNPGTPVWRH
jgi:hypothetical protein